MTPFEILDTLQEELEKNSLDSTELDGEVYSEVLAEITDMQQHNKFLDAGAIRRLVRAATEARRKKTWAFNPGLSRWDWGTQIDEATMGWDGYGDEPIVCTHEWVSTGVPGGMLFCKHCDKDAPEDVR